MKHLLILFALVLFNFQKTKAQSDKPAYDSILAKKLHADNYGMKKYVMVLIKTGTNTTKDKKVLDSLFRGHMNNINDLANAGKLAVAGPFEKNDKYRGIFIFNVETVEEAKLLCDKDPAVKAKLFDVDLYPWYGSAALLEVSRIHKTIEKKSH